MTKQYIYVSGENDFYQHCFDTMCEKLESGKTIKIGAACIGHTRAAMVECAYEAALKKKYGNRLRIEGEYASDFLYTLIG